MRGAAGRRRRENDGIHRELAFQVVAGCASHVEAAAGGGAANAWCAKHAPPCVGTTDPPAGWRRAAFSLASLAATTWGPLLDGADWYQHAVAAAATSVDRAAASTNGGAIEPVPLPRQDPPLPLRGSDAFMELAPGDSILRLVARSGDAGVTSHDIALHLGMRRRLASHLIKPALTSPLLAFQVAAVGTSRAYSLLYAGADGGSLPPAHLRAATAVRPLLAEPFAAASSLRIDPEAAPGTAPAAVLAAASMLHHLAAAASPHEHPPHEALLPALDSGGGGSGGGSGEDGVFNVAAWARTQRGKHVVPLLRRRWLAAMVRAARVVCMQTLFGAVRDIEAPLRAARVPPFNAASGLVCSTTVLALLEALHSEGIVSMREAAVRTTEEDGDVEVTALIRVVCAPDVAADAPAVTAAAATDCLPRPQRLAAQAAFAAPWTARIAAANHVPLLGAEGASHAGSRGRDEGAGAFERGLVSAPPAALCLPLADRWYTAPPTTAGGGILLPEAPTTSGATRSRHYAMYWARDAAAPLDGVGADRRVAAAAPTSLVESARAAPGGRATSGRKRGRPAAGTSRPSSMAAGSRVEAGDDDAGQESAAAAAAAAAASEDGGDDVGLPLPPLPPLAALEPLPGGTMASYAALDTDIRPRLRLRLPWTPADDALLLQHVVLDVVTREVAYQQRYAFDVAKHARDAARPSRRAAGAPLPPPRLTRVTGSDWSRIGAALRMPSALLQRRLRWLTLHRPATAVSLRLAVERERVARGITLYSSTATALSTVSDPDALATMAAPSAPGFPLPPALAAALGDAGATAPPEGGDGSAAHPPLQPGGVAAAPAPAVAEVARKLVVLLAAVGAAFHAAEHASPTDWDPLWEHAHAVHTAGFFALNEPGAFAIVQVDGWRALSTHCH